MHVIDNPSPSIYALARQLLAIEASRQSETDTRLHEAVRVHERLRISLTRLAGSDGFISLLRRALVLARADVPSLEAVKIKAEGQIEGLGGLPDGAGGRTDAALALTARLLDLLVTFIGEPLTLRLVREAWPEAFFDEKTK